MNGNVSNLFVILLGMGTVFVGLICIVFLCKLMSFLVGRMESDDVQEAAPAPAPAPAPVQNTASPIANRQEIIAAACAVIAEETGNDVKNIRVVSFKRV